MVALVLVDDEALSVVDRGDSHGLPAVQAHPGAKLVDFSALTARACAIFTICHVTRLGARVNGQTGPFEEKDSLNVVGWDRNINQHDTRVAQVELVVVGE